MNYERAKQVIADLPDGDTFVDRVATFLDLNEDFTIAPCRPLLNAWLDTIKELYEQNIPRTVPVEPPKDTLEHARWRDQINALCVPPDVDRMWSAIVFTFEKFTEALPPSVTTPYGKIGIEYSGFTVPLASQVDVLKLIDLLIYHLVTVYDTPLFPKLHDQIFHNCERIANKPFKSTSDVITPKKYKGDRPLDFVAGTPLERLFHAAIPVYIPEEARFMSTWMCAVSGKGKSTTLYSMILEDIKKQASVVVIDSKGDQEALLNLVKPLKSIKDRLVLLEPSEEYPICLNPFDIRERTLGTIESLGWVFSALLKTEYTKKQQSLFKPCLSATLCHPNPTIVTFKNIIQEGVKDLSLLPADPDGVGLRSFFANNFKSSIYKDTKDEIMYRISDLLMHPILGPMLGAKSNTVDFYQLMQDGKVVLIDNSYPLFGAEGAEFIGRLFLYQLIEAAGKRSHLKEHQKKPCFVYIDEAQHVIFRAEETISRIIDTMRSQKVACTFSHQRCDRLDDAVINALANCAIRMANVDEDARVMAPRLRTTAEHLQRLPRGTFCTYIRDLGTFDIKVPLPEPQEHMTLAEQQAIREASRAKYCRVTPQQEPAQDRTSPNIVDVETDKSSTDSCKEW